MHFFRKTIFYYFIAFCFQISSAKASSAELDPTFVVRSSAKASMCVYEEHIEAFDSYKRILSRYDLISGFGASAYLHESTSHLIISFRGTNNLHNTISDIGFYIGLCQKRGDFGPKDIIKLFSENIPSDFPLKEFKDFTEIVLHSFNVFETGSELFSLLCTTTEREVSSSSKKSEDFDIAHDYTLALSGLPEGMRTFYEFINAKMNLTGRVLLEHTKQRITDAKRFYIDCLRKAEELLGRVPFISITGHSLGGLYAQIIGALYGQPTETFNAPGAQELYLFFEESSSPYTSSIISNNVCEDDIVSKIGRHLGTKKPLSFRYLPEFPARYSDEDLTAKLRRQFDEYLAYLIESHSIKRIVSSFK